ncbi:transcription elongation factor GreA [Firmicutes bacterium CAG:791]|nr:transcription elongation factor GreA [Firmicutes bacterium CAG:791]
MEICRNVQVLHPAAEGILCGRSFLYLFRIFRGRNNKDMEEKKNILTYAGLKKYEDELHSLKVERRQEVAQKIKEAMEQGDLSENAEYDAAKDEQRDIEARIEELEKILKNVEVVTGEDVALDRISVGCRVKIHDIEFDEDLDYSIVGSTEANSLENKISNESPVGKALMGAKVGDVVKVDTMAGSLSYKILSIAPSED